MGTSAPKGRRRRVAPHVRSNCRKLGARRSTTVKNASRASALARRAQNSSPSRSICRTSGSGTRVNFLVETRTPIGRAARRSAEARAVSSTCDGGTTSLAVVIAGPAPVMTIVRIVPSVSAVLRGHPQACRTSRSSARYSSPGAVDRERPGQNLRDLQSAANEASPPVGMPIGSPHDHRCDRRRREARFAISIDFRAKTRSRRRCLRTGGRRRRRSRWCHTSS